MASEIRVDKITHTAGVGTITPSPTGVHIAGIVTGTTFSGSGASLTSLPAAQLSGTLPAISGANLTNLAAANLTGTIADARFPATLPAASAANLTSIPAANVTGTLPALTAANLTNIPAANIVGLATAGFNRSGGFGGGKLLKIHYASTGTSTTVTTPTRADTGLSITFTPEALGSTFYIQFHQVGLNGVSSDQALFNLYLMRSIDGGTATEEEEYYYLGNFTTNDRAYHVSALAHYDNPTYSAGQTINYHIEVGFYTGNYGLNYNAQVGQNKSQILVYEFGA